MRRFLEFLFLSSVVIISSCNRDEVITTAAPPEIILDDAGIYSVKQGDEIRLAPRYERADDATFEWVIENNIVCTERAYVFYGESHGEHFITLTVTTAAGSASQSLTIDVVERFKVYEYTPAPGQFIGDTKSGGFRGTELTAADAVAYADQRIMQGKFVSLGAFGGYIVLGLERTIPNDDGYDFAVRGNAFEGSSEPGIVWVMQDENGNGMADDTWYELRGSETGAATTIQEYAVTYYRPSDKCMPVAWSDSEGESGTIEYLESFHDQDSYYPTWIAEDSYTLRGTRLESRSYDSSGNGSKWINPAFDWGYADNTSPIDATNNENSFDISNAIGATGESITLGHIDFVKIQSAIQQQCGWAGELSTEIRGIREL